MRVSPRITVALFALLAAACGGTVDDKDAAANDTTPATVNLLITRAGLPNLEVQGRTTPAPQPPFGNFGPIGSSFARDFSVLATATDNESGIRYIKLIMTRTVCLLGTSGNLVEAYKGSVTRKEATYAVAANAPKQASLGDTGIMNSSTDRLGVYRDTSDANLLIHRNAGQQGTMGVGVSTRWSMEARNHAGQTSFSDVIVIAAGNTGCVRP